MTGTDYNVANMMFFIPYILLEVPANTILMKFKRPSLWIEDLLARCPVLHFRTCGDHQCLSGHSWWKHMARQQYGLS